MQIRAPEAPREAWRLRRPPASEKRGSEIHADSVLRRGGLARRASWDCDLPGWIFCVPRQF
eukprot:9453821-Alexandrium_andersonii.AAC.1